MLLAGALAAARPPSDAAPAGSAPAATTAVPVRIPGTAFRLGMRIAEVDSMGGFRATLPTGRGVGRKGTCRFFGLPAEAALQFEDGQLVHASFVVQNASPRFGDYVADQLRRLGYRRDAGPPGTGPAASCWNGRTQIRLAPVAGTLTADVVPATTPPPPPVVAAAVRDTVPVLPETLMVGRTPATAGYPEPEWFDAASLAHPTYPEAARRAGVQGVVRVLALVDTTGLVIDARIRRSIPELDSAALDVVRRARFMPYVAEGRSWRVWVEIPVRFTVR